MSTHFAICVDNEGYPVSLERHKMYSLLPDDDVGRDGDLRVIDESGEDYLYPAEMFVPIPLPEEIEPVLLESFGRNT
ncbi:MAG: hypothetical protein AB1646_09085 [Thermodesulfobacteriota bacterium]